VAVISPALAEKMAALLTEEYFQERGQRASRAKFLAAALPHINAGDALDPGQVLEGNIRPTLLTSWKKSRALQRRERLHHDLRHGSGLLNSDPHSSRDNTQNRMQSFH